METWPFLIAQQDFSPWTAAAEGLLKQGPMAVGLMLILIAGAKRVWVFAREIDERDKRIDKLERISDEQRQLIYELVGAQKKAITVAETVTTKIVP